MHTRVPVSALMVLPLLFTLGSLPCVAEEPASLKPVDKQQIEAWRKEYAYESLADRLEYERPARAAVPVRITPQNEELLQQYEDPLGLGMMAVLGSRRAYSLRMLHSDQVEEFVSKSGFGIGRFAPPGPTYFPLTEKEPIAFDKVPPLSSTHEATQDVPLPLSSDAQSANAWKLPPLTEMIELQVNSQRWFTWSYSFGDVKSVHEVAGFGSHGFRYPLLAPLDAAHQLPERDKDGHYNAQPRWKIARLELVSLLKHASPAVYVSEHLPRMDDLKNAQTRPLLQFEADSLAKLREGEDVQARSTGNRIEMLGSIRAAKQCLDCHQVPRGTLLGAFSYQLQRDPPMPPPTAKKAAN